MENIESKHKVSEIKAGTHLVVISDMFFLRDVKKELVVNKQGHTTIVVAFKDGKNNKHEQSYLIDNGLRQKYLNNMMDAAQISYAEKAPTRKECIGKRLWISIKEIHYINDDVMVIENDEPKIDHFIFRVYPYIEGGRKPSISGDPENNNGIAAGEFMEYKNISEEIGKLKAKPAVKPEKQEAFKNSVKEDPKSKLQQNTEFLNQKTEEEMPVFGFEEEKKAPENIVDKDDDMEQVPQF